MFYLTESDRVTKLTLTYFISYKYFLLAMLGDVLYAIFSDPYGLCVGVFIIGAFIATIFKQKNNGRQLIEEITSTNNS
ncbi:MAG TPA: hypothetical protein VGN20_27870 [Mucilaginibacter sp.]